LEIGRRSAKLEARVLWHLVAPILDAQWRGRVSGHLSRFCGAARTATCQWQRSVTVVYFCHVIVKLCVLLINGSTRMHAHLLRESPRMTGVHPTLPITSTENQDWHTTGLMLDSLIKITSPQSNLRRARRKVPLVVMI